MAEKNVRKKIYISIVAIGCAVSACLFIKKFCFNNKHGYHLGNAKNKKTVTILHSKNSGQALIGGDFNLIDHNGQKKTLADFKGKFMLVYFGYSFCPDICPAALNNITHALKMIPHEKLKNINPIFITVDPERDDVRHLQMYINNYHELFIALTGNRKQIDQIIQKYKVYAQKATPDGTSTEYLIDHSSIIYLMDRQGRFITSFNHQTPPKEIFTTLTKYLK